MPPASSGTTPRWDGVLVRFGEIGIKSGPVRRSMTERLRLNLLRRIERDGLEGDVVTQGVRLWMAGPDALALCDAAVHTFGVVSASPAQRRPSTMVAMQQAGAELALASPPAKSFAIRSTREGTHTYTSQDVGIQVGSAAFKALEAAGRPAKVDLSKPELELFVEVRDGEAYLYTERREGPGGLPEGCQGRAVARIDGPASLAAAWLMMRRGCDVVPVHAGTAAPDLSILRKWGLNLHSRQVAEPSLEGLVPWAEKLGASVLVTGDGLRGPFEACSMPVLRPLAGLSPAWLAELCRKTGLPTVP